MTRRLKAFLSLLIALLLLLLIALAGRLFWRGAQSEKPGEITQVTRQTANDCDLNKAPCRVELPGGGVLTAELAPRPLVVLQPLTARLTLQDIPAESAQLTFFGIDMDMPFDPTPLQEIAPGQFIGQVSLPVCVTGPMRWRAEFSIIRQRRQRIIEFLFYSQ
ncbi:MAG: hypothetical protein LBD68_05645 [Zoogloeaceae bacterium]|jgi:hypothetical protein|nr:hypothetical protein [Zoogloeaceae bacterium]